MTHHRFAILQLGRVVFAAFLTLFLHNFGDLATPFTLLLVAVVIGVVASGWTAQRQYPIPWLIFVHVMAVASVWLTYQLLLRVDPTRAADFVYYRTWEHIRLVGLFYFVAFIGTWLFWHYQVTLSVECFLLAICGVWLLSGHREYQLDAPNIVSNFAWSIGIPAQYVLATLGVGLAVLICLYLLFAHERPLFGVTHNRFNFGSISTIVLTLSGLALLALFASYGFYILTNYAIDLNRMSEGVGEATEEGTSPLGFHSAVGQTRQPAALLRLGGDFKENPWSPMLYLRESALSAYNGKEMVLASPAFDSDVPRLGPTQAFSGPEIFPSQHRIKLQQSVYLLTKHSYPFAVDYPIAIGPLRNPDPERFVNAYQVSSLAPALPLPRLVGRSVGSTSWSEQEWSHYLRAPGSMSEVESIVLGQKSDPVLDQLGEDLRYRALAKKLVSGFHDPILKAANIIQYLSRESIYTRSPGHQITPGGDPVAPYLFDSEKRGYCVHFAHAAVYLLRLAGIPARIGTGYLTDLSYAKDGHVLLHLGDRHAWPEIFIENIGWVVADISPERAENEQMIVPDMELLNELMSKIDPIEALIPPTETETNISTSKAFQINFRGNLGILVLVAVVAWLGLKFWLHFSYLLPAPVELKARRAYFNFAALLADSGLLREVGETRRELAARLAKRLIELRNLTLTHEALVYGKEPRDVVDSKALLVSIQEARLSIAETISWPKRALALLSPVSVVRRRRL